MGKFAALLVAILILVSGATLGPWVLVTGVVAFFMWPGVTALIERSRTRRELEELYEEAGATSLAEYRKQKKIKAGKPDDDPF